METMDNVGECINIMRNIRQKKYVNSLVILMSIFMIFTLGGCGYKKNKINKFSLTEIKIQRLTPISGQDNSFKSEVISTIKDKKIINKIVASIEGAEKEPKDLGYVKKNELHHEIRLIYKNIDKKSFSLWVDKNSKRAVISNIGYFYLDEETTEEIKTLLFEKGN